jgi:hydrogenase-4 component F
MGVIALGIGFGNPLALAGVVVHITGHAAAKALGFYAAVPLLSHEPHASGHPVGGVARTAPALGTTMAISLGALAGLPPSPLFVSEVLIVAGGFAAGRPWPAAVAAILLSLGFLGLAHALLDTLAGRARHGSHRGQPIGLRAITVLTAVTVAGLLALTAIAFWLPGSELAHTLAAEIR